MSHETIFTISVHCPAKIIDVHKVMRLGFVPQQTMLYHLDNFQNHKYREMKPRKVVYCINKLQFEVSFGISLKNEDEVNRLVSILEEYGWRITPDGPTTMPVRRLS